jgi:hypothetical protein
MASSYSSRRQQLLPPFSEGDHDHYLSKINQRLSGIKEEIQVTIEDNMALFMETLDHTMQLSHQVDRVSQELKHIRSRVADPQVCILIYLILFFTFHLTDK